MKYSMFIGRWQPWHKGHRWLIDQRLNENKNVLICIREVSKDDKNPYNPDELISLHNRCFPVRGDARINGNCPH